MNDFEAGWLGARRVELDECGSTNDEAARLARAGASHGTVVTARTQRAGRGRDGRVWASPPGLGLYVSAIVRPPLPIAMVPPMTLAIGIGVCDTARELGVPATLKWPNDALVAGRKLAGVLVETQSQGGRLEAVIVGIGMNLGGALPATVDSIATTLEREAATSCDRDHVLATLLGHVERWIDRYIACGLSVVIPAWQERMARGLVARANADGRSPASGNVIGRSASENVIVGELVGLDGDGALLLRDRGGGMHRVRAGDVELLRPESAMATC